MFKHFIATLKDEKGQALSEYGLILALIAVIAIGALTVLGGNVSAILTTIGNALALLGKGTAPAGGRQWGEGPAGFLRR